MRYKLTAEVVGNLFSCENLNAETDGYVFNLIPGQDNKIVQISISKNVPEERIEMFRSTIGPGKGDSKFTIQIGGDQETHDDLIDKFQMIESNLSFSTRGALQRIKWETPDQEYIPETEEEQILLAVSSFSYSKEYPEPTALIEEKPFRNLIKSSRKYDSLRVPKAFWREGLNYFHSFQYVQSFYQFYFIIEDFYANGKSGKNNILGEFHRSSEFKELCENSLDKLFRLEKHKKNLEFFFDEFNCDISPRGLQELLFEMRGALHHYSSRSTRPKGNPFNQEGFKSIALLSMHLVTRAIGYKIADINQKDID